eukprot:Pgem_evm1s57
MRSGLRNIGVELRTDSVNEHSGASNYLSDAGNHTRASRINNDTNNNDSNTKGTTNRKTAARG